MPPTIPAKSRLRRRSRSYAFGSCWIKHGKTCRTQPHGSAPLKTRTVEIQSRADALLKAADEKVKAAEERARIAEEWLTRVYDTIASEFAVEPVKQR